MRNGIAKAFPNGVRFGTSETATDMMKRTRSAVIAAGLATFVLACGSTDGSSIPSSDGGSAAQDASIDDAIGDEADANVEPEASVEAASANPALDAQCTPAFTLQLEDTTPKGQLFTDAVPDPEGFVQQTGREVCKLLYRAPEEVRDANHITLIIRDDPDYAGWKSGNVGNITVMISTNHLSNVKAQGKDVAEEIKGILLHEMTHMYQNDDKAAGEGTYPGLPNVIEGIADFVRIRAGHPPDGAKPSKTGVWDDTGYSKPAFFLLWIDGKHPDFLYRENLAMQAGDGVVWSPDTFEVLTGSTVDVLWQEYSTAACCVGSTQTCCK